MVTATKLERMIQENHPNKRDEARTELSPTTVSTRFRPRIAGDIRLIRGWTHG